MYKKPIIARRMFSRRPNLSTMISSVSVQLAMVCWAIRWVMPSAGCPHRRTTMSPARRPHRAATLLAFTCVSIIIISSSTSSSSSSSINRIQLSFQHCRVCVYMCVSYYSVFTAFDHRPDFALRLISLKTSLLSWLKKLKIIAALFLTFLGTVCTFCTY